MNQEPMTPGQMIGATFGGKAKGFTVGGASPSGISSVQSQLYEFRKLKNSIPGIGKLPDDMAMKMLPQIMNQMSTDPKMVKDIRLQATIIKMMQVAALIQQMTLADEKALQARQAAPQILPQWAR